MKRNTLLAVALLLIGILPLPAQVALQSQAPQQPQSKITTPKEHFGFNLGDDYCLANYQQLMSYWAKLEKESDRLKVVKIGVTEEGRPHLMGVVTSAANHKNLGRYQQIARRLAQAEGLSAAAAAKLAADGKA